MQFMVLLHREIGGGGVGGLNIEKRGSLNLLLRLSHEVLVLVYYNAIGQKRLNENFAKTDDIHH